MGASAARLGGGGLECTASGVPQEDFQPGDLAFPQISAPPARPSPPVFTLRKHSTRHSAKSIHRRSHKSKGGADAGRAMAGLSVRARSSGAEGDGAGEPSTSRPAGGGRAAGRAGPSAGPGAARRGGAPGGDTRGVTGAPSRPGAGGSPAKRLRAASGGAGGAPWVDPGSADAPAAPGALGKQDSFVVSGSGEARTVTTTPQRRGPGLWGGSEARTAARPTPAGPAPAPPVGPRPPPRPRFPGKASLAGGGYHLTTGVLPSRKDPHAASPSRGPAGGH